MRPTDRKPGHPLDIAAAVSSSPQVIRWRWRSIAGIDTVQAELLAGGPDRRVMVTASPDTSGRLGSWAVLDFDAWAVQGSAAIPVGTPAELREVLERIEPAPDLSEASGDWHHGAGMLTAVRELGL